MSNESNESNESNGSNGSNESNESNGSAAPAPLSATEQERLKALLRSALDDPAELAPSSDVLRGFQHRVRQRSAGKFYTDGWSTAHDPPLLTYLLTSLFMLLIVVACAALLLPLSGPTRVSSMQPKPLHVEPQRASEIPWAENMHQPMAQPSTAQPSTAQPSTAQPSTAQPSTQRH